MLFYILEKNRDVDWQLTPFGWTVVIFVVPVVLDLLCVSVSHLVPVETGDGTKLDSTLEDQEFDRELEDLGKEQYAEGPPWRCDYCGEENPESFEACWKCKRSSSPGAA